MSKEMEMEVMTTMEDTDMEVYEVESEEGSGSGLLGVVAVIGAIGAAVGGIAYAVKHKDEIKAKRLEKQAAKLEAAGYIVERPIVAEVVADYDDVEDEEAETIE